MTAQEIIEKIEKLPPEEKQVVIDYVETLDIDFKPTQYSDEVMAKIDHDIEEARQGIHVVSFDSMEEARRFLFHRNDTDDTIE